MNIMNNIEYLKEQFDQLQAKSDTDSLSMARKEAFRKFSKMGVPTTRHEEWKYTRVSSLLSKGYQLPVNSAESIAETDFAEFRLPGHEQANEIFFINGKFSPAYSTIRSVELTVMPLEDAHAKGFGDIVDKHFGHSADYLKDGINALNTAFVNGGVFMHIGKGKLTEHPVYIYHITDARKEPMLTQPRGLVHIGENAQVNLVETFATLGLEESFSNQVLEIVVEKAARLEYYKIQNEGASSSQVSTTHIRHTGKSYSHAVTITLNGGIVRNNMNVVLEASHCEAHLYGLYFPAGNCHIDNHTIVDNVMPHCFSNELYKGMLDGSSTGVFNGKIFVRQPAQKTNAFQSNKNVLLSDTASVNTKPQLEIFADDVKCSHGCTVGRLDEEGLFYLQSRGIPEKTAKSMLLQGFASDVLDKITCEPIRDYVDHLIAERLEFDRL